MGTLGWYRQDGVLSDRTTLQPRAIDAGSGRLGRLADPIEAQNVNAFDEVPNSTWFTNRQFFSRRPEEELTAGPTTDRGAPDTAGPWTAIAAKASLGSTPGSSSGIRKTMSI